MENIVKSLIMSKFHFLQYAQQQSIVGASKCNAVIIDIIIVHLPAHYFSFFT